MSGAHAKSEPRDEIHADILSPDYFVPLGSKAGVGPSQHSKKLYKLTRQLTHIKNHLVENNDQTYLLDAVEEVITLITSYRDKTRELPFDWIREKFLLGQYRGAKLVYPPGKSPAQLEFITPLVVNEKSDDEDDAEESLRDPNFSRLRRLDPLISKPLVDHSTKALAVSYLSCLESICKTIDDLSKEKIKRLRDIYRGLGGAEVYTAAGELGQLKHCYGLTKKGLRSRFKEDGKWYSQSYSIQKTNSGPKQASSSKGKTQSWRY